MTGENKLQRFIKERLTTADGSNESLFKEIKKCNLKTGLKRKGKKTKQLKL